MADIFFLVFIYPLETVIELAYLFAWRICKNSAVAVGLSIIGVSGVVNILLLPLYAVAEKAQNAERTLQKRLKPKVDKIKAAFKGDEQYMILRTYYRQNHYHPLYALRGSLSVLIQAPFFIAAYHFLSNLEALRGTAFLFLRDLSAPDMIYGGGGELAIFFPLY
jgi:membrane protein insertase Oxa1/YidC/SpoIIIJ